MTDQEQQEKTAEIINTLVGATIAGVAIGKFGHIELLLDTVAGTRETVAISGETELPVGLTFAADLEVDAEERIAAVFMRPGADA